MVFQRFYNDRLAQASYLVGCSATGEAIVIDPNRKIETYVSAAEGHGLRITAVTETHIHADYLSGAKELAARTEARLYLSDEGGSDWSYAFASEDNVTPIKDGSVIRIGNVRLDVLHTPGHTPEHLTFLLTDEPAGPQALGAFTGDFVFVGDVGRPDLLERAANIKGTMEAGGRQLYSSIQGFRNQSDGLLIWPGHGAGSACGKSLGGAPASSLGYEKATNWALKPLTEDEFVSAVLEGQPDPPKYFAMMKRLNKEGPAVRPSRAHLTELSAEEVKSQIESGGQVVDLRHADEVMQGFLLGTLSIPDTKSFLTWAGWLLDYGRPITLIAQDEAQALAAADELGLIGLDNVAGWASHHTLERAEPRSSVPGVLPDGLRGFSGTLLDVRSASEYDEGHVPGALNIPLGYLSDRLNEVPKEGKVAVYCATGGRSAIASVLLKRHGFGNVCNVLGGFDAYKSNGHEYDVGGASPVVARK